VGWFKEGRQMAEVVKTRSKRLSGEERRLQIIEAAAALFSKKGFSGTTTREIARTVGTSEATVFKHFATKEALYDAIIEAKTQARQMLEMLAPTAKEKDDRIFLTSLAQRLITRTQADPTLMRLLFFSALEGHALSDRFFQSRFTMMDQFLAQYIAGRVEDGAFRSMDPTQAALNFFGMVSHHILLRELFHQGPHLTTEGAVEEMVNLFLHGVQK
jgi:AcrR family transcriptional regulator